MIPRLAQRCKSGLAHFCTSTGVDNTPPAGYIAGMRFVIVPNELRDQIHAAITKALEGRPVTDAERETLYQQLLAHYDEHGAIPDFSLAGPKP